MKKSLLVLFLLLPAACFSQEYTTGEIPLSLAEIKEGSVTDFKIIKKLKDSVNLSDLLPFAGSQGAKKQSCWAWATAYAIRSVMDKHKSLNNDNNTDFKKVYSPEYVYQFYKGDKNDCGFRANSAAILEKLLKDGSVKYSELAYDPLKCNIKLVPNLIKRARQAGNKEYECAIVDNLNAVKKVLNDGSPLVISVQIDDYFKKAGNINSGNPFWKVKEETTDHHAMVVAGYNDRLNALLVLNSWGRDFGKDGYVWISYSIIEGGGMNYACYPKKTLKSLPAKEGSLPDEDDHVEMDSLNNSLTSWVKKGYFRSFENFKIVLSALKPSKGFAVVEIRDENDDLKTNFYIDAKTSREFYIEDRKYKFSLDNIAPAGYNVLKQAAYFTMTRL